ncbi:ATP-binding protein [Paenibacillus ferrarius]|uniref:ATP-binding protein n=1 Tax=Paenibacillus ferrarius TaxID=1469647 RepID=UPI003D2874BD
MNKFAVKSYTTWKTYSLTTLFVSGVTLLLYELRFMLDLVNIILLFLFPVLLSAVKWGRGPSFYAAGLGVLAFDFFFVPPTFSLSVGDLKYLVSFFVFVSVAALTASLASRLRKQMREAQHKEASTAALYALSRKITAISDLDELLRHIVSHIDDTFAVQTAIYLPDADGELQLRACTAGSEAWAADASHPRIAGWVQANRALAGRGTSTLRESEALYVPLATDRHVHGVLLVQTGRRRQAELRDLVRAMEALADLSAVAVSRVKLAQEAKLAQLTAESEKLRTALLDSLSHELRTPLATILGSVTSLLEGEQVFSADDRRELLLTTREGAARMSRLVNNLLGMVRIESGMLRLNRHWCDIADVVGVALQQLADGLQHRRLTVRIPPDLPSVPLDEVMFEQVLVNLLSNAVKYSAEGSRIELAAQSHPGSGTLSLTVEDEGAGIPPAELGRIFDKFYRGPRTRHISGTGLGLAICKSIVEAHGGTITATNGEKGTLMHISLPLTFESSEGA